MTATKNLEITNNLETPRSSRHLCIKGLFCKYQLTLIRKNVKYHSFKQPQIQNNNKITKCKDAS